MTVLHSSSLLGEFREVRKSVPKFVKEDSKYTTQRPVNRCQIRDCQWDF